MPIYEYECQHCGEHLECMQKVGEAPLSVCPHCGKKGLKKCISMPSFQLKGSGWYATDYRDKGKKSDTIEKKSDAVKDSDKSSSQSPTEASKAIDKSKIKKEES